ncbi:MAG: FAD-dependent oxidoreductase [Patescibacteria group bacterium]
MITPCVNACPLKSDIPEWVTAIQRKELAVAYRILTQKNPFPGICGEICHHPCEKDCLRGQFDKNISIKKLEKRVSDAFWFKVDAGTNKVVRFRNVPRKEEKVAIIGAGPAGMACAWCLLWYGYQITIFEASDRIGGMPALAIPESRLSIKILLRDFEPVIHHPFTTIKLNTTISSISDFRKGAFNAIVIATGAHDNKSLDIPGENQPHVISGLRFLKKTKDKKEKLISPTDAIIVIGEGNTAINSAIIAKQLGASRVEVFCSCEKKNVPTTGGMTDLAKKEGVGFNFLLTPAKIEAKKIVFTNVILGEKRTIHPVGKTSFKIISATGEKPSLPEIPQQKIPRRVFICGDAISGPSFVSNAIASGIETGEKIHRFLSLGTTLLEKKTDEMVTNISDIDLSSFEKSPQNQESPFLEAERCFSCKPIS